MKKYFVAKEGIQKGPWSLDEISQNIQNRNLSWNDYIYDEKINVWLFLFEFPLLTETFNKSFKNPIEKAKKLMNFDSHKDRVWYILKANENYGPFTSVEMIQMLQNKALFEFDFVWRQDQQSWKRLADVDEFKTDKIKDFFESSFATAEDATAPFYRRKFPRAKYKCELLIHDKKNVFSAESIEIGEGGASFKIDNANFKTGGQIYLHFKPGNDVPAFNATCTVVSKNGNKYGVSFVTVSSAIKNSIEKFANKVSHNSVKKAS